MGAYLDPLIGRMVIRAILAWGWVIARRASNKLRDRSEGFLSLYQKQLMRSARLGVGHAS